MYARSGILALTVAALCACGSNQAGNKADGAAANASTSSTNAAKPADPTLAQEVQTAAAMIKNQLPLRQPNGVTISGVEARGTELILEMQVPGDVDDAKFKQMEQQLPVIACANPQAQEMFRRGGTYTYNIVDPGGEKFTASVNSCAASGS